MESAIPRDLHQTSSTDTLRPPPTTSGSSAEVAIGGGSRPFRFEMAWLSHKNFHNIVSSFWNSKEGSLLEKNEHLMGSLKEWNRTTFGNIFHRKRRWLARLNGVQRILAQRPVF